MKFGISKKCRLCIFSSKSGIRKSIWEKNMICIDTHSVTGYELKILLLYLKMNGASHTDHCLVLQQVNKTNGVILRLVYNKIFLRYFNL